MEPNSSTGGSCRKCRVQEATHDSRGQPVCKNCFTKFIADKCIKQIGILGKEIPPPRSTPGGPPTGTRRYLLGLSMGVSSTVLLHLLHENVEDQLAKGRSAPFDLVVVHVDTSDPFSDQYRRGEDQQQPSPAAAAALDAYRQRYPRFAFHCVPLSSIFDPATRTTIDWSALPFDLPPPPPPPTTTTQSPPSSNPDSPASQASQASPPSPEYLLRSLLASLPPTVASHTDMVRLLTRHLLVAQAAPHRHGCQALLLGHSGTALAELALAEVAKGRGRAVPALIGDGPSPIDIVVPDDPDGDNEGKGKEGKGKGRRALLTYHPLRDALRAELVAYAALTGLTFHEEEEDGGSRGGGGGRRAAVVSHKDLSIERVVANHFAGVRGPDHLRAITNVVRTAGRLAKPELESEPDGLEEGDREQEGQAEGQGGGGGGVIKGGGGRGERCGLCRMPLDETGDERWRGELGVDSSGARGKGSGQRRLCHGCERLAGR